MPQVRGFVTNSKGHELLGEINLTEINRADTQLFLAVSIDREKGSPCVYANVVEDSRCPYDGAATAIPREPVYKPERYSMLLTWADNSQREIERDPSLNEAIQELLALFYSKEMYFLETWWTREGTGSAAKWKISKTRFGFDDAAYKSCNRQEQIHRDMKQLEAVDPQETMAEKDGIVYIK